jgi:hypothetical protein
MKGLFFVSFVLTFNTNDIVSSNHLTQMSSKEQEKFFQSCQFHILSQSQQEVVTKCNEKVAVHSEYVECSTPILENAGNEIKNKCCTNCLQCSGCEDDRSASMNYYEFDSPGAVSTDLDSGEETKPPTSNNLRNNF